MPRTRPRRDYCTRSTTAPQHLLAPPSRFYTPRDIATPRARRARARTAWRERAARGLFRGGRDLFLRAVVVENDAGEYELQHDEVAEIALASIESCHTRDGQRTTPQAVAPL